MSTTLLRQCRLGCDNPPRFWANCGGRADTAEKPSASLFPYHLPVGLQGTLWSPSLLNQLKYCAQKKGGPGAPDTRALSALWPERHILVLKGAHFSTDEPFQSEMLDYEKKGGS